MTLSSSKSPVRFWPALVAALLTFFPLLQNQRDFRALFYFEDEWDLLNFWDQRGFGPWAGQVFAENFVPFFKTIWGGSILFFDGSYFALIVLLWLTHALNAALLCRIAQRLGCGVSVALLTAAVFGLSPLHYESLGWSVQWSAVLALTFALLGLLAVAPGATAELATPGWKQAAMACACSLASALCFSRGVVTGPALALVLLLTGARTESWAIRTAKMSLVLLPSLAVGIVIASASSGNHQHLRDALHPATNFALHYFGESPLRTLFSETPVGDGPALALALVHLALAGIAWKLATPRLRPLVAALLAFEIGNAVLLGIGRYHTGIPSAGGSRYQYSALAGLLPLAALIAQRLLILFPRRWGEALTVAALAGIIWHAAVHWPPTMHSWRTWRGEQLRAALAQPNFPKDDHFTRLPWMTNERARELVTRFSLH